jgi:type 1 glutamine amidotransferase
MPSKTSFRDCGDLFKKVDNMIEALLITGNDHPAHKWEEATPLIRTILEKDSLCNITVSEGIEILKDVSVEDYDLIILNYCNWKHPLGLSEGGKEGFLSYLGKGGGLIILHFANGAFHYSLPGAGESDWPEYRRIVHRVWDHEGGSTHDPYGEFEVKMTDEEHFITKGINDFSTSDEIYYNQVGEEELPALYSAVSAESGKPEPLAWAYEYKNARVFQTLLGHSPESYEPAEYREILRRAVLWVTENNPSSLRNPNNM